MDKLKAIDEGLFTFVLYYWMVIDIITPYVFPVIGFIISVILLLKKKKRIVAAVIILIISLVLLVFSLYMRSQRITYNRP
ncbi:MAG: hypothetical protein LBQ95_02025 [Lachnospiraceae bacterium]|jgi:uncharacterized membrane protein|nr:hypothetical protein [Lachnospiraceae bacterium]